MSDTTPATLSPEELEAIRQRLAAVAAFDRDSAWEFVAEGDEQVIRGTGHPHEIVVRDQNARPCDMIFLAAARQDIPSLDAHAAALTRELEAARAALRWYADPLTYEEGAPTGTNGTIPIDADKGAVARRVLRIVNPSQCNCWISTSATCGDSRVREKCPVHGETPRPPSASPPPPPPPGTESPAAEQAAPGTVLGYCPYCSGVCRARSHPINDVVCDGCGAFPPRDWLKSAPTPAAATPGMAAYAHLSGAELNDGAGAAVFAPAAATPRDLAGDCVAQMEDARKVADHLLRIINHAKKDVSMLASAPAPAAATPAPAGEKGGDRA